MTSSSERFAVHVPDGVLDDLHERLRRWKPTPSLAGDGWQFGVDTEWLTELVGYWRDSFDWRAVERRLNEYEHYRTEVDGQTIHYVHVAGKGTNPIPLVLTHGWPWTFWDFAKVIGPLTDPASYGGDPADAFEVVIPSLPGYGYSAPLSRSGLNYVDTADLWVELMTEVLGYPRFAAHGGDWGALVTSQIGHKYADRLYGIHVAGGGGLGLFNVERPWADLLSQLYLHTSPDVRPQLLEWERRRAAHVAVHTLDPQTLAHAMHDSPVGLAAWLLERRWSWSDCHGDIESRFTKDELLTTVMIYWVTQTFWSSARFYAEATRKPWVPSHDRVPAIQAPTGVSIFVPDRPPGVGTHALRTAPHVSFFNEHTSGGHFAAAEEPDLVVADIRSTFRPLRSAPTDNSPGARHA